MWNLNAYDNALAPVACKVRVLGQRVPGAVDSLKQVSHSCAPNLTIRSALGSMFACLVTVPARAMRR